MLKRNVRFKILLILFVLGFLGILKTRWRRVMTPIINKSVVVAILNFRRYKKQHAT